MQSALLRIGGALIYNGIRVNPGAGIPEPRTKAIFHFRFWCFLVKLKKQVTADAIFSVSAALLQ
jgi:hypothetical protein